MLQSEHEAQWTVSRQSAASRVRPHFQIPKFMFTIVWSVAGFHAKNLVTSKRNFNSEYFVNEIIQPFIASLFPEERVWQPKAYGASSQLPGRFLTMLTKVFLKKIPSSIFLSRLIHRIQHH
jgi:hypothetical protein